MLHTCLRDDDDNDDKVNDDDVDVHDDLEYDDDDVDDRELEPSYLSRKTERRLIHALLLHHTPVDTNLSMMMTVSMIM